MVAEMRRDLIWMANLLMPVAGFAAWQTAAAGRPSHAVLFIIDGLSYKAVDRLELPHLKRLIAAGTYYEKSYNILPAHPKSGEWARYQSSSLPNPVILAGTVLLARDQRLVQHSFFPQRVTAHAANDVDYQKLNVGFHLTFMKGSDQRPTHDDETIAWALEFLRRERPAFMRIHLQDTGTGGYLSYIEKDASKAWRHNIWAPDSPYRQYASKADEYLGQFLRALGNLGIQERTVLFVTADHGQADTGWHPPEAEDAWAMPLVVAGPGVRPGQRFPYAEQIDIVPTLCHLMGATTPPNADGRILAEALARPPANVPPRRQLLKEWNRVLIQGEAWIAKLRAESESSATAKARLKTAERDFYGIDRILDWSRFGSMEKLIAHHRRVMGK